MKTELTQQITKALSTYTPQTLSNLKLNYFRQSFGASEVLISNSDVTGGIVDYMKFNEYFVSEGFYKGCKVCNKHFNFLFDGSGRYGYSCKKNLKSWKEASAIECNEDCRYSVDIQRVDYKPLFTCLEIKVSKEDFHSSHGHNFKGNLNYYVIPSALYKELKNEIPEDIGVIAYTEKSLRQVKISKFIELTDSERFERLLCLTKAILKTRKI